MDIVSPLTFGELSLRLVMAVILGAAVGFDGGVIMSAMARWKARRAR